jgi:putative membrane protein
MVNMRTTWLGALSAWSLAAAVWSLQATEAPPRVATRDDAFVQRIAADVLAEVQLGRLAAQQATRAEVKEFARTLADEQSRAYEDLKALAAQKKFSLPSEPRSEQKAQIAELEALKGAAFDEAYLAAAAASRAQALALFDEAADAWGDPDVKTWAAQLLPTLKQRLARARELAAPAALVLQR